MAGQGDPPCPSWDNTRPQVCMLMPLFVLLPNTQEVMLSSTANVCNKYTQTSHCQAMQGSEAPPGNILPTVLKTFLAF